MTRVASIVVLAIAFSAHASDIKGRWIVDIDIAPLLRMALNHAQSRNACRVSTVGYRYVGEPGQRFQYAGDVYEVPNGGQIELIATRRDSRHVENVDQFGFAERELPMPQVRSR